MSQAPKNKIARVKAKNLILLLRAKKNKYTEYKFMLRSISRLFLFSVLVFGFAVVSTAAQDRPMDREMRFPVKFAPGANSATVKKRIALGTSHTYTVRAKEGQTMTVILTTGKSTSFTVYAPTEGIIEGADGETMWRGMLNESGEYQITIGTDKTANYTLEIFVK